MDGYFRSTRTRKFLQQEQNAGDEREPTSVSDGEAQPEPEIQVEDDEEEGEKETGHGSGAREGTKVGQAWERTQAAYAKVKASTTG